MFHELHHRIKHIGPNQKRAQQERTPVPMTSQGSRAQTVSGPAGTPGLTGGSASPSGIETMPEALITLYPEPGGYATVGYQGLEPVFTADGAAIPATNPGQWDQWRAAGRA
jgi:hypothetical protein